MNETRDDGIEAACGDSTTDPCPHCDAEPWQHCCAATPPAWDPAIPRMSSHIGYLESLIKRLTYHEPRSSAFHDARNEARAMLERRE